MISVATGAELARLILPRIPSEISIRTRLLSRLCEKHAITVLSAPTGYGKTTLVSVWLEREFTRREDAATTRVIWVNGGRVRSQANVAEVIETVTAEIESATDEVLVIVDQYDQPDVDKWELELVELIREHRNLRGIFTGRNPHRPGTWNALDLDLDMLTGLDLQFNEDETRNLLQEINPGISSEEAVEIHRQVGGWPILVRAAGLSGGDLHAAAEYLKSNDVESQQDGVTNRFVWNTAQARDFAIPMAIEMSGDHDAEAIVRRLEQAGLAKRVSSPGREARFRYLPIVGDVAQAQIGRAELRRRWRDLALWCASENLGEEALYYGIKAEAWEEFRGLAVQFRDDVASSQQLQEMIKVIDPDVVANDPVIASLIDVLAGPDGRIGNISETTTYGPDANPRDAFGELATRASFARFNGDFEQSRELFGQLRQALKAPELREEVAPLMPMIDLQALLIPLMTDELHECGVGITKLYREARHRELVVEARNSVGILALLNVLAGNGAHATEWFKVLDEMPTTEGLFHDMVDTCAQAARALFELGRLDFSAGRAVLDQMNAPTVVDEMWPFIVFAHSEYALLTGNIIQGLRDLEATQIAHSATDVPGSIARTILAACRANLLLARGDGNRALATLTTADENHPMIRVVRARIELLRGENQRAIVIAHETSEKDQSHDRAMRELRLIAAVAHLRSGEKREAGRVFKHFISDDGVGMLRSLALSDRSSVQELIELTGVGGKEFDIVRAAVPDSPFVSRLNLASLTRREQLVLELLQQDMTLNEVAEKLVVSGNTVKSQVRSLYRKLEVNSRADAVQRAVEYGLIS